MEFLYAAQRRLAETATQPEMPPRIESLFATSAAQPYDLTPLSRDPAGDPVRTSKNGGAEGIRTLDPHVANVVLSQLSYCPIPFV